MNNLQNSEKTYNEEVLSFFTPKLTKEELKLVERENQEHMETYIVTHPDVDIEEMKKPDSKDKYVHTKCIRSTKYLSLESERTLSEDVLSNVSTDVKSTTEGVAGCRDNSAENKSETLSVIGIIL